MKHGCWIVGIVVSGVGVWYPTLTNAAEAGPAPPKAAAVSFSQTIRPILFNHCVKCHGPGTQKAGLRLDNFADATADGAITPGKPDESLILERILSDDPATVMPPPGHGEKLSAQAVEQLREWITAGANYTAHWAYIPPVDRPPPGPGHPIDAWVDAALAPRGMTRSNPADRETLLRRLSLDLIGLPPTLEEREAFLQDTQPDALARQIERLLASPHYGEKQARHWLDLARYADSNGYTIDGPRMIWPYRDWVIRAFNDDLPYDQFTRLQLAGDLLPNAPRDALIATGFHRNTSFNEEGGTDPEQFRVERTIDRTNTTATVWLGLTLACAQCHDHKYDTLTQADYFRLYAYFNNLDEPTITVGGSPELEAKINAMNAEVLKLKTAGKVAEHQKLEAEIRKLQGNIPTTLVLREAKQPRRTFIQIRGDFLRPGEEVQPGSPEALPGRAGPSRLDLVDWLMHPDHPLTSRVAVNRVWQQLFGLGLVETENDFGIQGAMPTHPELLDHLAVYYRQHGWSLKALLRYIVSSETYQQASVHRSELTAVDPNNRWLGRQNRLRLEAELIRDQALVASDLLTRTLGGPGVYPPLPAEVFSFTQTKRIWKTSTGPDRYRRGLYTYIWRQSQHHLLTTFDGADAQTSCTRRNRSNTPLQALHLANDPAFQEFAVALGRLMECYAGTVEQSLAYGFLRVTGRSANEVEMDLLRRYHRQTQGSWTAVARVLLNLDEAIHRE